MTLSKLLTISSLSILLSSNALADAFSELDNEFNGCKKQQQETQSLQQLITTQNLQLQQCKQNSSQHKTTSEHVEQLATQVNLLTVENKKLKREIAVLKRAKSQSFESKQPNNLTVYAQSDSIGSVLFELGNCKRIVATITCTGFATSLEQDTRVNLYNDTKMTLDNGDTFKASLIELANKESRYQVAVDLIKGVRTKFRAQFKSVKNASKHVAAISYRFNAENTSDWITFRHINI